MPTDDSLLYTIIIFLGIALLLGFFGGKSIKKIRMPQVVGFIIIGIILGNSLLGVLSSKIVNQLDVITWFALAFIGFAIGGEMSIEVFRKLGKSISSIVIFESLGAFVFVTLALFLLTHQLPLALLFGALSSATAPAATVDVLREYEASGPLTTTIYAVVGLDDAMAVIIYAFSTTLIKSLLLERNVTLTQALHFLQHPVLEIARSLAIGIFIGLLLAIIIRRVYERESLLLLGLGSITLCTGLALAFHSSLILANMTLGFTVINLTRGHTDIFDEIEKLTPPVYVLFFVLVGARFDISLLAKLGLVGIFYIIFRTLGKGLGSDAGARIFRAPETVKKYLKYCLLSQAGVAIGLAMQALRDFRPYGAPGRELGLLAVTVIAATTFVFQIAGPPFTRFAIIKAGEARPK